VKLTTHPNLVPKLRIREAIPPLPQYALMVWCSVKAQGRLYTQTTRARAHTRTHTHCVVIQWLFSAM